MTQLDLKEAGNVLKPSHTLKGRATGGQSSPPGPSLLGGEKGEDVYILYEEEEEEGCEEGEEVKEKGSSGGSNTLHPSRIRSKSVGYR